MKKLLTLLVAFTTYGLSSQTTGSEHLEKGNSKANLKDYYGAIADYTKATEIDPNYANAYVNSGNSKEQIGDANGACSDWKKATKLGHKQATKWVRDQCN